jgi:hypothetical protein
VAKRLRERRRNLRLVHTPVHSSWLNQIEIYFSIVQRKVLTPNDFTDLEEVEHRLAAFERRYEHAARRFEWKFTRDDRGRHGTTRGEARQPPRCMTLPSGYVTELSIQRTWVTR